MNEYLAKLIEVETNLEIKRQLKLVIEEKDSGERIGDETPNAIKKLCQDGYEFFKGLEKPVVDIACGNGFGIDILDADYGIDIHINHPKAIYGDLFDKISDVEKGIESGIFFQAIEHFTEEEQKKILKVITRDCKWLAISTNNKDADPFIDGCFLLSGKYNPYHKHEFDAEKFEKLSEYFDSYIFYNQFFKDGESTFTQDEYPHHEAINFYIFGRCK